jgi:mannitol/fructose-specific phosphotransferase system IIA component (Ntr-type)
MKTSCRLHIKLGVTARQRDDVLQELVEAIPEIAGNIEAKSKLLRALHERERLHSTGISDGVALPHARNGLVGLVDQPIVLFGRHDEGVPFGAIDGQPSKLFFLLVASTVTEHLALLARLSRYLRDTKLREKLLAAERPDQVRALLEPVLGT